MTGSARRLIPPVVRAIAMLVLVLAGALAIFWLKRHELNTDQRLAPIAVHGKAGERVVARALAATVVADKPLLASHDLQVTSQRSQDQVVLVRSTGLWLAVPVTVELLLDAGPMSAFVEARDGTRYGKVGVVGPGEGAVLQVNGSQVPVVDRNLGGRQFGPGIPTSGYLYFEVAPEKLAGLRLNVHEGSSMMPNDNIIVIDLGIDAARAQVLRTGASRPLSTFAPMELSP